VRWAGARRTVGTNINTSIRRSTDTPTRPQFQFTFCLIVLNQICLLSSKDEIPKTQPQMQKQTTREHKLKSKQKQNTNTYANTNTNTNTNTNANKPGF
jgi:hypothetical protein